MSDSGKIDNKNIEEKIEELLRIEDENDFLSKVEDLHSADIVRVLERAEEDKKNIILKNLSNNKLAQTLTKMGTEQKRRLVVFLEKDRLIEILELTPVDEIVDLLGEVSIPKSKNILDLMKKEDAKSVRNLMQYEEHSAGGLMTTEYIGIKSHMNVEQALERVKEIAPETEVLDYLWIVDDQKNLIGFVELRQLFTNDPNTSIEGIMKENVISVKAHVDQEEVADLMSKYDLLSIPVINDYGKLVGVITIDDIIEVLEEEATEDLLKISGSIEPEEEIPENKFLSKASVLQTFRARFPWLIIALFGGLLAGSVISIFRESLESVVILTSFIPVIMAMGGNTGTQSSTIFIRTLTLEEIDRKQFLKYVLREVKVGVIIGLVIAIGLWIIVYLWQGSTVLAGIVGMAMLLAITVANMIGLLVPWTLNTLGFDPAAASNPLITTMQDVIGLSIYFIIARIFIGSI